MKKYLVALGFGALLVLSACGESDNEDGAEEAEAEETKEEEPETHEIKIEPQSAMENDSIIVEGETNFEDGTEIEYRVTDSDGDQQDGIFNVEDGSFDEEIDVSDFTEGEIEVLLGYFSEMQPDDIQEIYGQNGEYIEHDDLEDGNLIFGDYYTIEGDDEDAEIVEGEAMEIDDYTLTVQDYALSTDHEGDDVLVIEYDWVNDSDENAAPHMTFSFTGYQDGVETGREGVVEGVDLGTGQSDVQPGGEVEGAETTVGIDDMDKELELELDVLISFDSEPYTTTIDLDDVE
ncbi:DUF5067 domain-containing protein [Salicibibacter cibarius]|uniref:DUF5067 domain-containing protein n=1 Tax=Salicibibacter cibarius TaxID=2743000 RepID=A0A7T7CBG0_9BACI|nr:DUF5067 domain-containing protein [Salicibibacter cibarius]QQK75845.1 DUF5067 domain-containing protein [Salicibibacter cibarius]